MSRFSRSPNANYRPPELLHLRWGEGAWRGVRRLLGRLALQWEPAPEKPVSPVKAPLAALEKTVADWKAGRIGSGDVRTALRAVTTAARRSLPTPYTDSSNARVALRDRRRIDGEFGDPNEDARRLAEAEAIVSAHPSDVAQYTGDIDQHLRSAHDQKTVRLAFIPSIEAAIHSIDASVTDPAERSRQYTAVIQLARPAIATPDSLLAVEALRISMFA